MQEVCFDLNDRSALSKKSTDWVFSEDFDHEKFAFDMINYMKTENGIGLAANQIGIDKKVFCMGSENIINFPLPFVLFNPCILEYSEETTIDKEGCLSYPGLFLSIKRPKWVVVEYQDYNGIKHRYKATDYASKCVQHEYDHLNGKCFVDIVSPLKLKLAKNKLRKNQKYGRAK